MRGLGWRRWSHTCGGDLGMVGYNPLAGPRCKTSDRGWACRPLGMSVGRWRQSCWHRPVTTVLSSPCDARDVTLIGFRSQLWGFNRACRGHLRIELQAAPCAL